jgi:hypothetical protein
MPEEQLKEKIQTEIVAGQEKNSSSDFKPI